MDFGEKDIKKGSIILIISLIAILAFFLIRPVIFSVVGGLILAYIFNPVYKKVRYYVRNPTISAFIILILIVVVVVVPIWFIAPMIIQQVFEIFKASQTLDVQKFVTAIFQTSSEQFIAQLTVTVGSIVSQLTSSVLNSVVSIFLELPTIFLHLFLAGFVFFYALRDSDKLIEFVAGISPFSKSKERVLIDQFQAITSSIVYGIFIVGIIQGILTGLGLLVFGIPNALVLTLLATFSSLIPILGPYVVWVPVAVYLFASGNVGVAFIYLAYNILIVSLLDNVLRSYLVSRKTNISAVIILIGMIGGIMLFGIMGLFIGPLVLAYLVTFLRTYKDKTLYSLFSEESIKHNS